MLRISILTLFPEMFKGPFDSSIVARACKRKLVNIKYFNIRDFAHDRYKTVDDRPYGGGVGMILRVDIIDRALQKLRAQLRAQSSELRAKTILLDPQGIPYTQKKAQELSKLDHLILLCGHYEGVDERIRQLADEEISVGDYITSGGEIPAMVMVDSVVRLIPGVLLKKEATNIESFSGSVLEYPQYTRPPVYKGKKVPEVLLSGDHRRIMTWRQKQSHQRTKERRPDLLRVKKDSP